MQYSLVWGTTVMNTGADHYTVLVDRENNLESEKGSMKLLEIMETELFFCKEVS